MFPGRLPWIPMICIVILYFTVSLEEKPHCLPAILQPALPPHPSTTSPVSAAAHQAPVPSKGPSPSRPAKDQCFLHGTPTRYNLQSPVCQLKLPRPHHPPHYPSPPSTFLRYHPRLHPPTPSY